MRGIRFRKVTDAGKSGGNCLNHILNSQYKKTDVCLYSPGTYAHALNISENEISLENQLWNQLEYHN